VGLLEQRGDLFLFLEMVIRDRMAITIRGGGRDGERRTIVLHNVVLGLRGGRVRENGAHDGASEDGEDAADLYARVCVESGIDILYHIMVCTYENWFRLFFLFLFRGVYAVCKKNQPKK